MAPSFLSALSRFLPALNNTRERGVLGFLALASGRVSVASSSLFIEGNRGCLLRQAAIFASPGGTLADMLAASGGHAVNEPLCAF
jgi:hypothetical protein